MLEKLKGKKVEAVVPAPVEAPAPKEPEAKKELEPMSVVSPATKMVAEVDTPEDFTVQGHYKGKLTCRNLTVAPNAILEGQIAATTARIMGQISGEIKADSVLVHKGSAVRGELTCKSIGIQPGCIIQATIDCNEVGVMSEKDVEFRERSNRTDVQDLIRSIAESQPSVEEQDGFKVVQFSEKSKRQGRVA